MGQAKKVAIIGAGNVAVAPAVVATLASWYPEPGLTVVLFDKNEERLDLVDRLARQLFNERNKEASVLFRTDLDEALEDATEIVLSLDEDGARRMTGETSTPSLDALEQLGDFSELRRGDPNRPTPNDQLSAATRHRLEVPDHETLSREEAILHAVQTVFDSRPLNARVVSLVRGVEIPVGNDYTQLVWPEPIAQADLPSLPFQILRWILGDEPTFDLVKAGQSNPLRDWLDKG